MKIALFSLAALCCAGSLFAQTYVPGYTRANGTQVGGYYRSDANNTTSDNYSTKGNYNPYTGAAGTKKP